MCFSATVSFGSGIILGGAGIVSIKQSKTSTQKLFASIPFIFAIQQIAEGFLWLALKDKIDPSWQTPFTYLYIFIAQVVWPFWVPLSILLLEPQIKRKKIFYILAGIGCVVSLSILFRLISYPVYASVKEHHILYHLDFPIVIYYLGTFGYFIATVGPPFVSSVKRMKILGFAIFVSYIVTAIFFSEYVVSVWCFFAAIMSLIIYLVIVKMKIPHGHISGYKISDYQL